MCQSIECYPIIIDVMIYVLFINPFIRRDRDMTLYFNIHKSIYPSRPRYDSLF